MDSKRCLKCNECGEKFKGKIPDLVDKGWNWREYQTDTEFGVVDYVNCPDCFDKEKMKQIDKKISTDDENRQMVLIERLSENKCFEKVLKKKQKTLGDELDG